MRPFTYSVLILALIPGPYSSGQAKKATPALAFDARFVRLEEKNGLPTRLYFDAANEDPDAAIAGHAPIKSGTKFIVVRPDGERSLKRKRVLVDEEVKKHLQAGVPIRIQVSAYAVEEIRFGPALKPDAFKRVR